MNNRADGASGSGGGILNDSLGNLTVTNSRIAGNTASRAGGGIEDNSRAGTTFRIDSVMLANNVTGAAPGNGGGVHITGNGDLEISSSTVVGNEAAAEGGGLWNGAGTMSVTNTNITDNRAAGADADQGGGGIFNLSGTLNVANSSITMNQATGASGSGGGILNDAGGSLSVASSLISGNRASRAGGGIEDNSGAGTTFRVSNTEISGNATGNAPGNGGGIHITGAGDLLIEGGAVSGNEAAAEGGGLWNGSGTMMIRNLAVMDNRVGAPITNPASGTAGLLDATEGGGGVFNNGGTVRISATTVARNSVVGMGSGGGISNEAGGELTVFNSTVSGNSAEAAGGGINNAGRMNVFNVTVADNTAATGPSIYQPEAGDFIRIRESIVTGAGGAADLAGPGTYSSGGYNVIGAADAGMFTAAVRDTFGSLTAPLDAGLLPLADNGGPTMTHALGCPSPAIDRGVPNNTDPDQRGLPVFGGVRDAGAFERQTVCDPTSIRGFAALTDVDVYPNPAATDRVTVSVPSAIAGSVTYRVIEISSGRELVSQRNLPAGGQLDVSRLPAGFYVLDLRSGRRQASLRLVLLGN